MVDEQVIAAVRRFLALALESSLPVAGAVLYGSQARGQAGPDSDIDVLVLLRDTVTKAEWMDRWVDIELTAKKVDPRIETWPVRLSDYRNDQETPLIDIARQEGIELAA